MGALPPYAHNFCVTWTGVIVFVFHPMAMCRSLLANTAAPTGSCPL